jgi:hypothetical protein
MKLIFCGENSLEGRERENNGGDEPNWSITCIYENITTKPSEKLSYTNKNI